MQKKYWIILIAIALIWTALYWIDYLGDDANKPVEDLYRLVMQRGYITVGVKTDCKPFGFLDASGKNVGYDVDIAHEIARQVFHDENKVKFVPVTETDRLYLLNLNKVDMVIATLTITKARTYSADFTKPYYIAGQALLVKKGSSIRSLGDLADKKVGVIFGSTAEQTIKFLLPTAKVLGYKSYEEAYQALKAGTILGITSDDAILRDFSLYDSSVEILPKRYSRDCYGIAFRNTEESASLLKLVDQIVQDMDKQGKLARLRQKWDL